MIQRLLPGRLARPVAHILFVLFLLATAYVFKPIGHPVLGNNAVLYAVNTAIWYLAFLLFEKSSYRHYIAFYYFLLNVGVCVFRVSFEAPDIISVGISCNIIFLWMALLTHRIKAALGNSRLFFFMEFALYSVLLQFSILMLVCYKAFGLRFGEDVIFALMQTNSREMLEYLQLTVPAGAYVAYFLLATAGLYACAALRRVNCSAGTVSPVVTTLAVLALGAGSLGFDYAALSGELAPLLNAPHRYEQEYARFVEAQSKFAVDEKNLVADKANSGELHVLVIGESSNKNMYSAYGYRNDTSPWIAHSDPILFTNAYSSHTHTVPSLLLALTAANQYNAKLRYESPSLINVLNTAGFHTEWLSNQNLYGVWDNAVTVIASSCDYLESLNKQVGESILFFNYDQQLIPLLQQRLAGLDQRENNFIVIHLMGNHGDYKQRIPLGAVTLDKPPLSYYAGRNHQEYDRSIRYADTVLQGIFETVSSEPSFMSLTYVSDHGEDPVAGKGHNSGNFTEQMAEIPLGVWISDTYQQRYPDKVANLRDNRENIFTLDLLFDSLAGLYDIATPLKEERYDFTQDNFGIRTPTTLDGKIKIANLPSRMSRRNIAGVPGGATRLLAHRINTIGAHDDAVKYGFKSFECDVLFDEATRRLLMGHGPTTLTGATLEDYLRLTRNEFAKLWLDVKNITPANAPVILGELSRLDALYGLRDRVIVESSLDTDDFNMFFDAGWHTSYYMPTKAIMEMMEAGDTARANAYADALGKRMATWKLRAISFDGDLYGFIKQYIEPRLPEGIVYHLWTGLLSSDAHFLADLDAAPYAHDPRVESVIVQSESNFKM